MSIYEPIESNDSRRHLQLRSPVTLERTGELVCANAEDVASAIARARAAQPVLGCHQHEGTRGNRRTRHCRLYWRDRTRSSIRWSRRPAKPAPTP